MSASQPSRSRLALVAVAAVTVVLAASAGAAGAQDGSASWKDSAQGGVWRVSDAGTVDFGVQNGSLNLNSADANSGWKKRVAADRKDEIEVHFTKGDTDWKFEAEVSDDDGFEVSKERDTQPADGGSYDVGSAATAEFSVNNGSLSLDSFDAKDGWSVTKRDEASDDIEVSLSGHGGQTAEFEAERTNGQTKLEISQKVTGPKPG